MQLRTPTFSVELEALRRADDEDWARVRVNVQAGGFTGAFDAWLQSGDLDSFSSQLGALYENVGHAGDARLACAERGIDISLSMEKMGGINGQFEFLMRVLRHLCQGVSPLTKAIFPSGAIALKVSPRSCGSMFFNWSVNMDPQLQKAASPQVLQSSCLGRYANH